MSSQVKANREVVEFLEEILIKNEFKNDAKITYLSDSENGENYQSRNISVNVQGKDKSLDIVMKCASDMESTPLVPIEKYYANEIHFYDMIYPTYQRFLKERGVEDGLNSIAKCYGTSENNIIALENLKKKGFQLCDATKPFDDSHIILVLKSLAEIHASSFAMKDQEREIFDTLLKPTQVTSDGVRNTGIDQAIKDNLIKYLASLDPLKHRRILERTKSLVEELVEYGENTFYNPDTNEYDILIQGDSWCNNMMFLYEGRNKTSPKQIVHVNWQMVRPGIPIIDLSYFFYSIAPKEALDNYDDYLKLYHDELSGHIRRLGSKPDIVYSLPVFKQQWKQHGKYGYYMAFMLIRKILFGKGWETNSDKIDLENFEGIEEYYRRLTVLTEHMVDNEFI